MLERKLDEMPSLLCFSDATHPPSMWEAEDEVCVLVAGIDENHSRGKRRGKVKRRKEEKEGSRSGNCEREAPAKSQVVVSRLREKYRGKNLQRRQGRR